MIDIRTPKSASQRECSWVRKFGAHEDVGWHISVSAQSANITEPGIDLTWIVDRANVPTAFTPDPVDLSQLKAENCASPVAVEPNAWRG
jgi:hypothetical protein